ncbi:class I SAM-dependent methyltransferase [Pseudomonas sp. CDFA 553]|uniref:class I SAM-dependent methyltransferase n=1 Tax=Pseudomonas quasicaspiana TaxID=2829821 RepID=UPI001E43EDC0|nr:methyltransferase [Pseudomonas quasicaspiana]MCD5989816.1 class I SAM-dependent methyltransferase [Pseudomonas quasicaspiana]
MTRTLLALTLASLLAPALSQAATTDITDAQYRKVLEGSWRAKENSARDRYRHPEETLKFFGLQAQQTVIEITPGGGWYSEILAPLLKDHGRYIAAVQAPSSGDYYKKAADGLKQKLKADPARYGKAETIEFDPQAPVFGKPGSADRVLTFRNVHNWVLADDAPQMFAAFFKVLKPGGVLGVVDHRAKDGADVSSIKASGYLPTDYVVKLATDAGFKLEAQSEVNANPKDTKDYSAGVWTLPPSYKTGDQDRAKYAAIGESDRFTLRFVKPVGN